MAWVVLMLSKVFEAGWALSLKLSNGFSRLWASVSFLVMAALSFARAGVGDARAARRSRLRRVARDQGRADRRDWHGVAGDDASTLKITSLMLIVAGVVGLNLATSGH